jgi:hypothetical protein
MPSIGKLTRNSTDAPFVRRFVPLLHALSPLRLYAVGKHQMGFPRLFGRTLGRMLRKAQWQANLRLIGCVSVSEASADILS